MARGLGGPLLIGAGILGIAGIGYIYLKKEGTDFGELLDPAKWAQWLDDLLGIKPGAERSEERRVGKECRSRWSPYH